MKLLPQNHSCPGKTSGFALIVSLTLMGFLVLLAVGLFSMASVGLKVSKQATAQVEAQSNARMALMLAIGELQKSVGPDRAITATSEIRGSGSTAVGKPNTTGVWESWWDFNPSASPNYNSEKISRFQRWLVSSSNTTNTESLDFVDTQWSGEPAVELVGDGTLGPNADDEDKVSAGLVPIADNGLVQGSYAWHVSDESVKARINLYRDPDRNATLAQKRALTSGHRPDASVIKDAAGTALTFLPNDQTSEEYDEAVATMGKITHLEQAELINGASGGIQPLRNDITLHSLGVMSNVREGGLKFDLSSAFEGATLPTVFNNRTLYASTHGITGVSDPNWSALYGYYNSYKNLSEPDTNPTYAMQSDVATLASVPEGFNPAPVIAKVDTIFSLIGRPLEDVRWHVNGDTYRSPWKFHDYFVDLIFTPIVTLHNPYNVAISFHKIKVSFDNIPIAFNFKHKAGEGGDFVSMSMEQDVFESINTMRWGQFRGNKTFNMTIANWADPGGKSDDVAGPIVLEPGETLVCSPAFPPDSSYYIDTNSDWGSDDEDYVAFDWKDSITNDIRGAPGFISGLGFEISGICFGTRNAATRNARQDHPLLLPSNNQYAGGWAGQPYLMVRDLVKPPLDLDTFDRTGESRVSGSTVTDEFYVEFKMQRPSWYSGDGPTPRIEAEPAVFDVTSEIQPTSSDAWLPCAKFEFDYENNAALEDAFDNRVYRYPPDYALEGNNIAAPRGVLYASQSSYVHTFAILSAYARTTNSGVFETNLRTETSGAANLLRDGRLAGKPYLFHNPTKSNFTLDLADPNQKPGIHAFELNFQPFVTANDFTDNYMSVSDDNRVPALTGNESASGIKSGSYLEIPSGPLQTLADFRRSNALSTSYLPHFVQPVGNSLLHPLMSANRVVEFDNSISSDELLDHSVLANHALYDRFYFSTFATRGSTNPDAVFEQFMNGTAPLASQAFQPYLPDGQTVADAKAELFNAGKPVDDAFRTATEYQMIRGPFNVNSTSVQAWKAVLAAMNKSEITTLLTGIGLQTNTTTGVPIPGMSLPNGSAIPNASYSVDKPTGWNGYRELTETELGTLAAKIVDEVRERGPFLSLSEFVNRRVTRYVPNPGDPDDLYSPPLMGALESAIAKAGINEPKNVTSATDAFLNQVPITNADISDEDLYNYTTPEASNGNPAAGAPGWVNQGDLLRILEPAATVRGDTFVIRVYGDAQDLGGNVTARAYAEAVVQRVPEYLDPSDRPSLNAATDSTASLVNQNFGRRLKVVSFRWLSNNEI